MQNCKLTITHDTFELSPETDRRFYDEVRLSGSLAEALKKIESRGWKLESGTVCFKREKEGLAEHMAQLRAAASAPRKD